MIRNGSGIDQRPGVRSVEDGLSSREVKAFSTPIPSFKPLLGDPRDLGFATHSRLEGLLQMPVASSDSEGDIANGSTGQRSGIALGDVIGRDKEFTRNLPRITNQINEIAANQGIDAAVLWDGVVSILRGSGIGEAMHRTLTHPFEDEYDLADYIDLNSGSGITLLVHENIANWGARRHDLLVSQLGSLSRGALGNIERIIYVGGSRVYSGAELWRPEIRPYVYEVDGEERSDMSEFLAAKQIHAPRLRRILGNNALEGIEVHELPVFGPRASGNYVASVVAGSFPEIKNNLLVEFGNAPAGHTQLLGALTMSDVLGKDFDPTRQYVAITDSVTIVHPDYFASLSPEEKSKVQNGATGLNSLNGWMSAVVAVNKYVYERSNS